MRSLFLAICATAGVPAVAQPSWTHVGETFDRRARYTDVLGTEQGYALIRSEYDALALPTSRTAIVGLDMNGAVNLSRHLWGESTSFSGYLLVHKQGTAEVVLLGTMDNGANDVSYVYYAMDADLQPIDSNLYQLPGMTRAYITNAVWLPEDLGIAAIMGGSTTVDGGSNSHALVRLSETGDSLDFDLRTSTGFLAPKDILWLGEDTLLVSAQGIFASPFFSQWSFAVYSKFNTHLDQVGGFLSMPYDGSAGPITFGNTFFDGLSLQRTPGRDLIITGRPSGSSNTRTVVLKVGPSGDWKAVFTPISDHPMDYPAGLKASAVAGNELLVASMENFYAGGIQGRDYFTPSYPNQVKVFKLDTNLNVICTNMVDGFAENAYYWVDRIKATSDGGYLLCGGRMDLDQPNGRMAPWAQKFGPADCFTSVEEGFHPVSATVSPNPGTEQLRFQVSGPIVQGKASLLDMNGREVASAALNGNSAEINTRALASGVYAYRITDRAGAVLGTGRWVRAE